MVRRYYLYFIGTNPLITGKFVLGTTLKHAKELFADHHNINVSNNIGYSSKISKEIYRGQRSIDNNQWIG